MRETSAPVRTCVACGRKTEKATLHRFVWRDGGPRRDEGQGGSGRGVYCCRDDHCLSRFLAQKKKWKRAFRL
ncbi:MAG: YlxR family protein [Desulfopila sp.]